MPRYQLHDAQAALTFLINQASYVEAEAYRVQYPEIIYPQLIPIDETAPDWVKSITFFSIDKVGQADWFNHMATDMRLADIVRSKFETGVEMGGIGYRYTLEEIGVAQQQGLPLTSERASAAIRAYEEFCNKIALTGSTDKGWFGLTNDTGVSKTTAPVGAAGSGFPGAPDTEWTSKTAEEIAGDINGILTGIYVGSGTVEMANTLLLPVTQFTMLATRRIPETSMTLLQWIMQANVYTSQTGQQLTIRSLPELKDAGGAGVDRMVAYRRSPDVIKMHIPMRHRFMTAWQTGPIVFDVPGIFRLGGVEIRRPGAIRYVDGI